MKYEQKFIEQQTMRNYTVNYILCAIIFVVECAMVLIWHLSQQPGKPHLDPGYLNFYWVGIIGALLHPIFNYSTQRWLYHKYRILGQLIALGALLIWACLFSLFDVRQGNSGYTFAQIMIFTSAGIWMPKRMHYGINAVFWLFFIVLIYLSRIDSQALYSEIINSGVFFLIAELIIHITDNFQYATFQATQGRLRLQDEQLDMMAEQIRTVHSSVEEARIMRHDLRHYARAVEQYLVQGEYAEIKKITCAITKDTDYISVDQPINMYTKIPEVDSILTRFRDWTVKEGVDFQAALPPPDMMAIRDLSLLLMNALENAYHAVKNQSPGGQRYIKVFGSRYEHQYYLNISNTYEPGSVMINRKTGLPVAAGAGHGYGTKSIASILKRYQANFRFQANEKEFCLQILLPVEEVKYPDGG